MKLITYSMSHYLHFLKRSSFNFTPIQFVLRSFVRDLFHPFQDCINLRIKTHTTKNIINNWLLLWQRGVNGSRPLINIHSHNRNAVVSERCSSHHWLPWYHVTDFMQRQYHRTKTWHSHLVPSRPWFQEIRMFTFPQPWLCLLMFTQDGRQDSGIHFRISAL